MQASRWRTGPSSMAESEVALMHESSSSAFCEVCLLATASLAHSKSKVNDGRTVAMPSSGTVQLWPKWIWQHADFSDNVQCEQVGVVNGDVTIQYAKARLFLPLDPASMRVMGSWKIIYLQ